MLRGPRRRFAIPLAAALLLSGLAACGGGASSQSANTSTAASASADPAWNAIVNKANGEGAVTWYADAIDPGHVQQMTSAFQSAYPGIKLTIVRMLPAELRSRVDAEASTGKVIGDVVSDSSPAVMDGWQSRNAIKTGLDLPNFKAPGYKADQWLKGKQSYFLWTASPIGFGWNTQLVPKGIKKPEDLNAPDLKGGKVGVLDPTSSSFFVDFYKSNIAAFGQKWYEDLAAQKPRIYPSAVPIAQALASGEIAATNYASPTVIAGLKAQGAPIDYFVPKNGWLPHEYSAVAAGSTHPNAALVLANWLLSVDGQNSRGTLFAAVRDGVKTDVGYVGDYTLTNPDDAAAEADSFNQQWNKMFR